MKKPLLTFALFSVCSFGNAQSVLKTMFRIPDTGASSSYTTTFGEDNDYTINFPSFIIHGNGTATDSITGLMWQRTDGGEMTIENAIVYCDTLSLGGYTDWRLPDAHEAFSILNHQFPNPALDTLVFTKTPAQYWWTSARQANDSNKVWVTNSGGGIGNHPKSETISAGGTKRIHVRAVRDVSAPQLIPAHFTDNGDGTVSDNLTGLTWQKVPFVDTLTWEQALSYADTLNTGGFSDWRLPNIKEMQSINLETIHHPSVDPGFFGVANTQKLWSSTTLPNQTTKAWYLDTQFGITTYDFKSNRHEVICVRGNTVATFISSFSDSQQSVYPNPFTTTIHIDKTGPNASFQLLDAEGRSIYSGKDLGEINVNELTTGLYFLIVKDKVTTVHKLMKN